MKSLAGKVLAWESTRVSECRFIVSAKITLIIFDGSAETSDNLKPTSSD